MPRIAVAVAASEVETPHFAADLRSRATAQGAEAVEVGEWRSYNLERLAGVAGECGLAMAALQLDTGGPLATEPDIDALMTGVAETIEVAQRLGVRTVLIPDEDGTSDADLSMVLAKLQAAAPLLEDAGIIAAIGPSHKPGALIPSLDLAMRVIEEVASPCVRLLLQVDLSTDSPADVDLALAEPDLTAYVRLLGSATATATGAALKRVEGTGYQGWVAVPTL